MTDQGPSLAIGGNNPPADPFLAQLEDEHRKLLDEYSDLEFEELTLPKVIETDEQAAKITAAVLKRRGLFRRLEEAREAAKKPYLDRGCTVDGLFGGYKTRLAAKADTIEKRNIPFLKAKQDAENARVAAEAKRLRDEAQKRQDELNAAIEQQRLAEQAQRDEETRLANIETERQRQIAVQNQAARDAASAPADEEPTNVVAFVQSEAPLPTSADAEISLRQMATTAQAAADAVERLETDARKADLAANRADTKASKGGLGKLSAGGGSARVEKIWVGRVVSFPLVLGSLGPLGPYLNETIIRDAVDRAARATARPEIPGVVFAEEMDVKTTASRKKD